MINTERPPSTKSPAFQFYPADFISEEKVRLMTNQQVGCYILLLCHCWIEGSIPADVTKIGKLCGEDGSAMADLWPGIRSCFTEAVSRTDRMINPRLEEERQKQERYKVERSSAGVKGAKARWDKPSMESAENGSTIAKPSNVNGSAIQEPIAKNASLSLSSSSLNLQASNREEPLFTDESLRWRKWYDQTFAGKRPRDDKAEVIDNAVNAGMSADVIIKVVRTQIGGSTDPLMYGSSIIANMFAAGVRTVEDAERYEQKQAGVKDGRRSSGSAGTPDSQTPGTGLGRPWAPPARTPHSNAGGSTEGGRRKVSDLDALSIKPRTN